MAVTAALTVGMPSNTVAPRLVHFNMKNSTADDIAKPFLHLQMFADFDDAGASAYSDGFPSTTDEGGLITAHVYETAGTYEPVFNVTDGVTVDVISPTAIVVANPDTVYAGTDTVVVSRTGDFTGKPTGAEEVTTTTLATALGHASSTKRVLFRRNEAEWTQSADWSVPDGAYVGAFGTGTDPIFAASGADRVGVQLTSGRHNVRVMDIEFDGNSVSGAGAINFPDSGGTRTVNDWLFLRCNFHHYATGIASYYAEDANQSDMQYTRFGFVRSKMNDITNYHYYGANRSMMIIDSEFTGAPSAEHVVRVMHTPDAFWAHNTISGGISGKHTVKWANVYWSVANLYNEHIVFRRNSVTGNTDGQVMWVGPQAADLDERLRRMVIEGCVFKSGGSGSNDLLRINMYDIAIRNNLFMKTAGNAEVNFVLIERRNSSMPVPDGVEVDNNTMYASQSIASGDIAGVQFADSPTNCRVHNNIGYTPSGSGTPAFVVGSGGSGTTSGNNSTGAQMRDTNPFKGSVSSSSVPSDFELGSGSYAVAGGATRPVFFDRFGRSRISVTNDMGFHQYTEGTYPWNANVVKKARHHYRMMQS